MQQYPADIALDDVPGDCQRQVRDVVHIETRANRLGNLVEHVDFSIAFQRFAGKFAFFGGVCHQQRQALVQTSDDVAVHLTVECQRAYRHTID